AQRQGTYAFGPGSADIHRKNKMLTFYQLSLSSVERIGELQIAAFAQSGSFYCRHLPDAFREAFCNRRLIIVDDGRKLIVPQPAAHEGMPSDNDKDRVQVYGFQAGRQEQAHINTVTEL